MTTRETYLRGDYFGKRWGWVAARGVFAIIFGLIALFWPGVSLLALVLMYGAYALVDGIASLVFAAGGGKTTSGKTWPLVVMGILGIAAGLIAFFWPGVTAFVLLWIVAAWAIATGILEVVAYFSLRKSLSHSWLLVVSGLLSVALGVALFAWPVAGLVTMIWMIGIYAILAGFTLLWLAFSMRRERKEGHVEHHRRPPGEPTPA